MIDLHTHTKYSDGTWDVETLLKKANENGVEILSITDHDTVKSHIELMNKDYHKYFSGKIIPGAEFNCAFDGIKIELLGYNFDVIEMDKWIDKIYNDDKLKVNLIKEFNLLVNTCKKNNIIIDDLIYDTSMGWPVDIIFDMIKKYPENKKIFSDLEWNNRNYFFRCCTCNKKFPVYVDLSYQVPTAKQVADKIRELGGSVFLAHLFIYPLDNYQEYLDKLVQAKIIDGIEVWHGEFNDKQVKYLMDYCHNFNLFMSSGTDCHGDKRPSRKVGIGYGNMNASVDLVSDWIK